MKLCRQREKSGRDRAYIKLNGRRVYLGPWGSPKAEQAYRRILAGAGHERPAVTTVADLTNRWFVHAREHYGEHSSEYGNFIHALRPLTALYGDSPVDQFGPSALKHVRTAMITGITGKPWA